MVDFNKLVKKSKTTNVTDLLKLFDSLDRQASHTELRPSQIETCKAISERRNDRDLVLKVSTGAGKTTIGLLFLESFMEELSEPAVYLCPTKQLVAQVENEAQRLGISAYSYPAGMTHPPIDCTRGKAILVCTYDKLFNAKTTFHRTDVQMRPCALVLDDAHAGIEEIRDSFTLTIVECEARRELFKLLNEPCDAYKHSVWSQLTQDDPTAFLEVPFWIWKPLVDDVGEIVSKYADHDEMKFVWSFLEDILRWCRCVVSGLGIEIIPDIIPLDKIMPYSESKHRLYMSATLADDTALVRELNCSISASKNPIVAKKDRGLGERMVLAPSLFDKSLDRQWVMKLCAKLSKKINVVILSPSEKAAKDWIQHGANVVIGDEVEQTVRSLRNPSTKGNCFVFMQRYDGVDLPDNSCRILVIDGMPYGEGIADKYDSSTSRVPGGVRNRLIYRIEQGMGRAVRSHVDYAIIILVGPDLANFIARKEVLESMNPETRAQLELALDLAKLGMEESSDSPQIVLLDMLGKALSRDDGWKQFYNENVRKAKFTQNRNADYFLELAKVERDAFKSAQANDPRRAASLLMQAVDSASLGEKEKSWYLQRVANYTYEFDAGKSFEIQQSAYMKNSSLFCPPGIKKHPKHVGKLDDQTRLLTWFRSFENPNGAIASIYDLRARLSLDGKPNTVEDAIKELAQLLGAEGSRPEFETGEGPDCLWLWSEYSFVLEVKNQSQNSLHKKDAGQLHVSVQWFKDNYPTRGRPTPITVSNITKVDSDAKYPDNTRITTSNCLERLLKSIEQFYQSLINELPLFTQASHVAELQAKYGVLPKEILDHFTLPLK
jgi:hypothetical protein